MAAKRPPVNTMGPVFTTEQIAELLQISQRTVQRAISKGELKAHRIGRIYRVADKDLQVWWNQLRTAGQVN
jgi:excisionase family DNA binding protein